MGLPVPVGFLWLNGPRRRYRVRFDPLLRARTLSAIAEVRAWLGSDGLPPPVNDVRCQRCQLLDYCQPELCANRDTVRAYLAEVVGCAC